MDAWGIMFSVVFSLVGMVYLKQGRANADFTRLFCGLALLIYPYFVGGALWIALAGAGLTALPFILERFNG